MSPPTERNIDFELDVRVEIDSGKCVLHPTPPQAEHEDVALRRYVPHTHTYIQQCCFCQLKLKGEKRWSTTNFQS